MASPSGSHRSFMRIFCISSLVLISHPYIQSYGARWLFLYETTYRKAMAPVMMAIIMYEKCNHTHSIQRANRHTRLSRFLSLAISIIS
jgi:hypothetical protein